ncbi:MAG: hypothetical protein KDA32_07090 [Phycisphaerales bacterium]|nr:hypothetical protein [Phycisphaerales bacterium]
MILGRGGYLTPGVARLDQRVRTAAQVVTTLSEVVPDLGPDQLAAVADAFVAQLGDDRPDAAIGLVPNLAASRIANRLDLGGPAYTVDAACASALVAVDQAVGELRSGRCDLVLAGGVHHCHDITLWSVFARLGALSPSGRIRPFGRDADGILIGEGTGILVLERLSDAERHGHRPYAVIGGVGLSSDGRDASLMSPRVDGQVLALERAYRASGIDPGLVELVEGHGTATVAGDRAELDTLRRVFGKADPDAAHREGVLGSVKSMIGHAMPAAGAAGLIKAVLAVHHGVLPPTLGVDAPNPALAETRLRTIEVAARWERERGRLAGVNAFGFGGINAHLLLEEHLPQAAQWVDEKRDPHGDLADCAARGADDQPIAVVGMEVYTPEWPSRRALERSLTDETGDVNAPVARHAAIDELEIPAQFRVPPNELAEILPQQSLMLRVAAAALRDADLWTPGARPTPDPRFGVYIGIALDLNTTNYHYSWALPELAREWARRAGVTLTDCELNDWIDELRDASGPPLDATRVLGSLGSVVASRIAREFAFGGPSFAVSSGSASGLRAMRLACDALRRREIDGALVGAVDIADDDRARRAATALRSLLGGEFDCEITDARSNNSGASHGAVALVLRRATDAHHKTAYAVVRDIATASASALTEAAIAKAADQAISNVRRPDDGGAWFEQIGPLGDVAARRANHGAASGLLHVGRAIAALHQRVWPADGAVAPQHWLRSRAGAPRRAVVAASDALGESAAAAMAEAPEPIARERDNNPRAAAPAVLPVYGDDATDLIAELTRLRETLGDSSFRAAVFAGQQHASDRGNRQQSVVLIARDSTAAQQAIARATRHLLETPNQPLFADGVRYTPTPLGPEAEIAFVYPGSGAHRLGMGAVAALTWPSVVDELEAESARLFEQLAPDLCWRAALSNDASADVSREMNRDPARLIQAQVAHGVLMTRILRHSGVRPSAAIGYSLGETTSLFALGAWPDRDDMTERLARSPLFQTELVGRYDAARRHWGIAASEPIDWRVVIIPRSIEDLRPLLARFDRVYALIRNTARECVIGGDAVQIAQVVAECGGQAIPVIGASTVHCPIAGEVADAYRALHDLNTTPPADIRFYSAAAAAAYDVSRETAAESITRQALNGFDFPALVETASRDGVRIFIEVGPRTGCARMIRDILGAGARVLATDDAENEAMGVAQVVATLIAERRIPPSAASLGFDWRLDANASGPAVPTVRVPLRGPIARARWPRRTNVASQAPGPATNGRSATIAPPPAVTGLATPPLSTPTLRTTVTPAALVELAKSTALAHEAFLAESSRNIAAIGELYARRASIAQPAPPPSALAFTREQCMQFAIGKLGDIFGPQFAAVDTYATRVRLPDEPLMLVDRILRVDAEQAAMTNGSIVTEHDVLTGDGWYLDHDRAPVCVTVEAGQADLFLCSWLGIDLQVRGERAYRLLDATIRFHRGLPRPGEVIRYDIHIDRFVRQGAAWLFFFRFEGTINGRPLLTMTNGCAGFFTEREIEESRGIPRLRDDSATRAQRRPGSLTPTEATFTPLARESYTGAQLDALRAGDLATCFGPAFAGLPLRDPPRIPDGKMRLIHRVVDLDPAGGHCGIGSIRAEADVKPDDWYLTCHFVDDMVMPGTLMYECCAHTLRVLLLRMGWLAERDAFAYEPRLDTPCQLKCRGPVTAKTRIVTYEVELKEIGFDPEPYVVADALMFADGKPIVRFTDMSMRLTGLTRADIERVWAAKNAPPPTKAPSLRASEQTTPLGDAPVPTTPQPPVYDRQSILEFAIGAPSKAFGDPYRPFDGERRIARLPGPPYMFLDRVTRTNADPWRLVADGWIEAQYDVPPGAWYFSANHQPTMPFAVLLEVALQPCGWLAAYLGSALRSETDTRFRNLGGSAILFRPVTPETGLLTTRIRITDVSEAAGMLIEKFDMQVWDRDGVVYDGDTYFGFFTDAALANQVGIRDAAQRAFAPPTPSSAPIALPTTSPLTPAEGEGRAVQAPIAQMPARALRMLDEIEIDIPEGGPHALGFLRGSKRVDPDEWFFAAHFYQDPVCPGSLGLESFLQLLRYDLLRRYPNLARTHVFEPILLNERHEWLYRGQILPTARRVEVDASIVERRDGAAPAVIADGFLRADGRAIYEMKRFGLRLVPREGA